MLMYRFCDAGSEVALLSSAVESFRAVDAGALHSIDKPFDEVMRRLAGDLPRMERIDEPEKTEETESNGCKTNGLARRQRAHDGA